MRILSALILISFSLLGCHLQIRRCGYSSHDGSGLLKSTQAGASVKYVYHQGCALRYPGNSQLALECAVTERAPLIEIDVRPARDGELFLFHDRRINLRAYSESMCAKGQCPSIALSELSSEEIGKWSYSLEGFKELSANRNSYDCLTDLYNQKPEGLKAAVSGKCAHVGRPEIIQADLRILKFEDLLRLNLGGSDLLLDMKGDDLQIARKILSKIGGTSLERRLIFSCGRGSNCLEELTKLSPKPRVLFRAKSAEDVVRALPLQPEIIQIDKEWSTEELQDKIKGAGAFVLIKALDSKLYPADYLLVDR